MLAIVAVFLSYAVWGLSPLYWKELSHLPGGYVVLHRVFWSFLTLFLWFGAGKSVSSVGSLFRSHDFPLRVLAATCLGLNWFVFILAIEFDRTAQASLGYFVLPILVILIGSLYLKEKLSSVAKIATGIVAAGVVYQFFGAREFPIFALGVMGSYLCYTVLYKIKQWKVGESALMEMTLLSCLALAIGAVFYRDLLWTHSSRDWLFLVGAGPFTILPVLLCNFGVKQVEFVIVGPLQYLNPTLQFLVATVVFGEIVTDSELLSFGMVWIGCGLFLVDKLFSVRSLRVGASSVS